MKTLFLTFILFGTWLVAGFGNWAYADLERLQKLEQKGRYDLIAQDLYQDKMYFSATQYAIKHIKNSSKLSPGFNVLFERIMSVVGDHPLNYLSGADLGKIENTTLNVKRASTYYLTKRYDQALALLNKVSSKHYLFAEAKFLEGNSYNQLSQFDSAVKSYEICVEYADKNESRYKGVDKKRYYSKLKDICQISIGRVFYKRREFERAIKAYDQIAKDTYQWPYVLLEKAWAYYQLGNFNRALGIIVTYDSPLMSSYFLPEAEVLKALSYYQLCLYDDSMDIINKYYKKYKPRSNKLRDLLKPQRASKDFFFNLLKKTTALKSDKNPFMKDLMTRISKKEAYQKKLGQYKEIVKEISDLLKYKKNPFARKLIKELLSYRKFMQESMNHYIKAYMFDFVNEIHAFSFELFNIQLEIISEKKDLVYQNKQLSADRARGSLDNVEKSDQQFFWEFKGAFWADELGDYSFGLPSMCKKVKKDMK